jgi:hypothetical protein
VLRKVEQALQSAIEKPFSRFFPQRLQPPEMKSALRRALEDSALATAEGVYAANAFTVGLNPDDASEISGVAGALERELAEYVREAATEARLMCGPYVVAAIEALQDVAVGQMRVQATFGKRPPAYLRAEAGLSDRTKKVALAEQRVIGRSPDCDIVVGDEAVSRRHCEIVWQYVQYVVRDLQSANGTFVNGQQVQTAQLRSGDLIEVGMVHLRFHDGPME